MTSSFQPSTSERRMSWAVWQLEHTGASGLPFATWVPCTLCQYCRPIPSWQVLQVSGMVFRKTRLAGSLLRRMSWLPWQSEHVGATLSPLLMSALPWMLSRKRSTTLPMAILPRLMIASFP
jgi:hypothetical protein